MVKTHEAAFVSSCRVLSGSTTYVASIVFFPRKNRGMFVQHIVSNDAGVIWNDAGQWDMSELEGGTADSPNYE
jgi:hypothetical protein